MNFCVTVFTYISSCRINIIFHFWGWLFWRYYKKIIFSKFCFTVVTFIKTSFQVAERVFQFLFIQNSDIVKEIHKLYSKKAPQDTDIFLIRIHSIQDCTANMRKRVTRKRSTKRLRLRHTGNLFRKNLQLKDSIGKEFQGWAVRGKKLMT